jgi:hypothetical protein
MPRSGLSPHNCTSGRQLLRKLLMDKGRAKKIAVFGAETVQKWCSFSSGALGANHGYTLSPLLDPATRQDPMKSGVKCMLDPATPCK